MTEVCVLVEVEALQATVVDAGRLHPVTEYPLQASINRFFYHQHEVPWPKLKKGDGASLQPVPRKRLVKLCSHLTLSHGEMLCSQRGIVSSETNVQDSIEFQESLSVLASAATGFLICIVSIHM